MYMLSLNLGYESSNLGHLLGVREFMYRFGYRTSAGTWVISTIDQQLLTIAGFIGLGSAAIATGILSDFLGRRKTILLGCLLCFGGIFLQFFARSIMMLFGGKILSGLGYGLGHSIGPVFVAEIAPVRFRGVCLAIINVTITLGQWCNALAIYFCQNLSSDLAWRIPVVTQILFPSVLLLIGIPFLPESPSWLVFNGKIDEAAKSLRVFNGGDYDTDRAIQILQTALEEAKQSEETKARWIETIRGSNRRRTLLSCMGFACQQLIGASFMAGYVSYFFVLAGVSNPFGMGQMVYSFELLGNMCSWPLIERVGRRRILLSGMIFMTTTLLITGCVSLIKGPAALKATVSLMTIWAFVYQMTAGAVVFAIAGETPSPRLRQKTFALNVTTANTLSTVVQLVLPYLINTDKANLGGKVAFVFFGPSVPCCIYLYFCLPEMKGRNVAEIEEMYQKNLPARKFEGYKCEVTKIESKYNKELEA
ncbi:general substrate transporter [Lipomyces kononenkoae]|uniref:General substrate transporter n=1 Tax=Lipomyces kononenkoae TaxID=34357 RepID=A0ACC3SRQ1_LIPKO